MPLLEMKGIGKRFGAVEVLRGVDFQVEHGEIVGLVGDNGAGKSTLMKIITGVHVPDSGEIYFNGERAHIRSPEDTQRLGIEMIYQDLTLALQQSVATNIFLGREPLKTYLGGLIKVINYRAMRTEALQLLEQLHIHFDSVRQEAGKLSGGQQQAVAIARALSSTQPLLIIMDEPTAALAVKEVNKVLDLARRLQQQGISVILISHRLEDIFEVCNRVIVLRRGKKVADLPIHEIGLDGLIKLMVSG